jgi:two-component system sensor histidine kinase BaeS
MSAASRRPPLRRVLLLAIGGVALGSVLITGALTVGLLRLTEQRAALRELERAATIASRRVLNQGRIGSCRALPALGLPEVCLVAEGSRPPALASLTAPSGRAVVDGADVLYVSRRVNLRSGPGVLYVFRSAEGLGSPTAAVVVRIVPAILIALGVAALVAYAVARRTSRPLAELAETARGLSSRARQGVVSLADSANAPEPLGASASEPQEVHEVRSALADLSRDLSLARERERTFLLSVSHELRTPLTSIRGYGEALQDGTATDDAKAGEVILSEARRLERLVQDLLDLGRLESGQFPVVCEESDLGSIAAAVADSLRPRAREAAVTLEVAVAPSRVLTDPDRAHQMLANLVENALRVTPASGRVGIAVDGTTVSVTDSGPGLDGQDLPRVFERFYLWGKYRGERAVGTGLGLAIVGELARLLEVKVGVRSEPGAGTTFSLAFRA